MTVIVDRTATRPRRAQGCSRCGQPRAAQIVLCAQHVDRRCRPLVASARGFCEACALDVFAALEHELERQLAGARPRGPELDDSGGTR